MQPTLELQLASLPLPPSRRLGILLGPRGAAFFPSVEGRRILLLGEYHSLRYLKPAEPGYEIQKWLLDLVRDAPECLDLFTELPAVVAGQLKPGDDLIHYGSGLAAIAATFAACSTESCPFELLRFHRGDIRQELGGVKWTPADMAAEHGPARFIRAALVVDKMYWDRRRVLYEYVLGRDEGAQAGAELFSAYMRDLGRQIAAERLLGPQKKYLARLPSKTEESVTPLLAAYQRDAATFVTALRTLEKELFLRSLPGDRFTEVLGGIYEEGSQIPEPTRGADIALTLLELPVDAFVLLKMFEKLDDAEVRRGPSGCPVILRMTEPPQGGCRTQAFSVRRNTIGYFGAAHAAVYAAFIERYFGTNRARDTAEPSDFVSARDSVTFDPPFDFFAS